MNDFLLRHIVYPAFEFGFGFLVDHWWLLAILAVLAAILIWRFLMPVVWGFNALFGWKGWATLAVAVLTFGAFGAGWRAHRASVLDPKSADYHGLQPTKPPRTKPKRSEYSPAPDDYVPFGSPENTPKPPRPRKKAVAK